MVSSVPVKVFFNADERNVVNDALRALGLSYGSLQGASFDEAVYTKDHRMVRLTRGKYVVHVPTRNILMIYSEVEESES